MEENPRKQGRPWRRIIVVVALVVLATVGAIAFGGLMFRRHVTAGEAFCTECHTNVDEHLRAQAHQDMPCAACHDASFWPNARTYFNAAVGSQEKVPHGAAQPERCASCHTGRDEDRALFAKLGGHERHVLIEQLACAKCHGGEAHVESFRAASCVECHDQLPVFQTAVEDASCVSCHAYSARRGDEQPPLNTPACAACHHGPEVQAAYQASAPSVTPAMVHGTLGTCGLCHNPHESAPGAQLVVADCTSCHASIGKKRAGSPEVASHTACETCHQPHASRAELGSLCGACHQERSAEQIPAALSSKHEACADCHDDHRFLSNRDDCARCHADENTLVRSWQSDKHQNCLSCHAPHSEDPMESRCTECHEGKATHQHEDCATCHSPHEDATKTKPCATCHGPQLKQIGASTTAKEHGKCADCHTTHAPASAPMRCASCHEDEAALAKQAPEVKHQACASCHQPHGFVASVTACAKCHEGGELGAHAKECLSCHQPHGKSAPDSLDCRKCHEEVRPSTGKHTDCTSCHAPHAAEKGPACADCHAKPAQAVALWKPADHQGCGKCHEHHDAADPKACGACHKDEVAHFSSRKHECATCHDPHQPPEAWWTTCAECHERQVRATAKRGKEHATCESCHSPHQPQIPACTTCHKQLGGAHGFPEHRNCTDCHDLHSARPPPRAACLTCHEDLTDHHPEAKDCASCHPFE